MAALATESRVEEWSYYSPAELYGLVSSSLVGTATADGAGTGGDAVGGIGTGYWVETSYWKDPYSWGGSVGVAGLDVELGKDGKTLPWVGG